MAQINKKRKMSAREERSIDEFELLSKVGEGAYGVVYKARDKHTRETVAVKKVKSSAEADAEASILARLKHRSIVGLRHAILGGGGANFLVMEYAENDVRWLLERTYTRRPFSQSDVKCLMQQLLQGVDHMHRNQVLHRDLKTSNLLLNNRGELKICDLGLACRFDSGSKVQHREKVVTLWYRAPELLLGAKAYSTGVDMWSVGCVMAELLSGELLFDGTSETDQLRKIYKLLGNPNSKHRRNLLRDKFPAVSFIGSPVLSAAGFHLLTGLLTYDPQKRMSAEEALDHPWFREVPLPKSKDFMPTFPERIREQSQLQYATGLGLFGF